MSLKTIKIGVIGLGYGASVQIPGFRKIPGVAVVALAGKLLHKKTLARPMASGPVWGDISRLRKEKGFFGAEWMLKRYR